MDVSKKTLEREVILADRTMVEQESDIMLENANNEDVCFLVVGDVFAATTHSDLVLRCKGGHFISLPDQPGP